MAGHSKWANIQHRKGAQDKKRAAMFAKLAREIMVAAKLGGGDPDMNPRLRLATATARGHSMPRANIENAIAKGVGGGVGDDYTQMRYEGYAPGGVAVIVEALTNNKNRTAGDVRALFTKYGGNMGETGSVNFMFDRIGEFVYPLATGSEDIVFEAALEAGAQNVESNEDGHYISSAPDDFAAVQKALEAKFGPAQRSALIWQPNVQAPVPDDLAETVIKLIDALEDHDDVQTVTTNMDLSDAMLEKLAS